MSGAVLAAGVTVLAAGTALLLLFAPAAAAASSGTPSAGSTSTPLPAAGSAEQPIPVLAHYYIWFNESSWERHKKDYPSFGRYSSDDIAVMRRQVDLAKRAGITGFLVSWKDTADLDPRLDDIVRVAAARGFKLGIVFQGLDYFDQPLPIGDVRRSFRYLADHYAGDPVFDLFGRPLVIWSGTWAYSRGEIASITRVYGRRLLILASEKQVSAYEAIADLVAGDAYYWSSADPLRTPGYDAKLRAFSTAVHDRGGLWFAPAAPGYDATLLGGKRVIPRRGGETLRVSMDAALASSPDAIAVISWNEYSENTMVEPSRTYGSTALRVIAGIEHADPGAIPDFDSSDPAGFDPGAGRFAILGGLGVLLVGSAWMIVRRRLSHRHGRQGDDDSALGERSP